MSLACPVSFASQTSFYRPGVGVSERCSLLLVLGVRFSPRLLDHRTSHFVPEASRNFTLRGGLLKGTLKANNVVVTMNAWERL